MDTFDLFAPVPVIESASTDEARPNQEALGQWLTPSWAAEALLSSHFPALSASDTLWEPTCGEGAFLSAIPDGIRAFGTEIDPLLAERARRNSGREVIVGDFRTAELPARPTAVIGNPPFQLALVEELLHRAHGLLENEAPVGLILPCSVFQTEGTIVRMSRQWSIEQSMIPRTLFPGLSMPLCWALFRKGPKRGLIGFSLYHETASVRALQARYKAILGSQTRSAWQAVTQAALEMLGGRATLDRIYAEVEGVRPTGNTWWREKVRQQLQRIAHRTGHGEWSLEAA
jgi:hypothetical protein